MAIPMPPHQPGRSPARSRLLRILLALPIGIIIALVLLSYVAFTGNYFPGELLIVLVIIFIGLFVVRMLYWRSRRRYWRQYLMENAPVRILRERYARGDITREQFDQALRDLEQKTDESKPS
jgi:uncharacterized membrane protein